MTQSKESSKSERMVLLPPPRLELSPLTSKYKAQFVIRWGQFEKVFDVDKETFGYEARLIEQINKALLDGSESKPYILQ